MLCNCFVRNISGSPVHVFRGDIAPFSHFQKIVVPEKILSDPELPVIIGHEKAHSEAMHSIDLLIAELLVVFQWFNPFAWLMKSAIRNNLEYQADQSVSGGDPEKYQMLLVSMVRSNPAVLPVISLHNSQLKNRIMMMKNKKPDRFPVVKKLAVVPMSVIMALLISGKPYPVNPAGDIVIRGKVTATEDNRPLESVNVIIKDRNAGTITDKEGNFSIRVDESDQILVVSCPGFQTKEAGIGGGRELKINLDKATQTGADNHQGISGSDSVLTVTGYTDPATGTLRMEFRSSQDTGDITVKGTVVSAPDRRPLPLVSVIIKGTSNGTVTDALGKFIIKIRKEDKSLIFNDQEHITAEVVIDREVEINQEVDIEVELDPE
jgi:hypothetical protein